MKKTWSERAKQRENRMMHLIEEMGGIDALERWGFGEIDCPFPPKKEQNEGGDK